MSSCASLLSALTNVTQTEVAFLDARFLPSLATGGRCSALVRWSYGEPSALLPRSHDCSISTREGGRDDRRHRHLPRATRHRPRRPTHRRRRRHRQTIGGDHPMSTHNTPGLDLIGGASQDRKCRRSRRRVSDDLAKSDTMIGAVCNMRSPKMVRAFIDAGECPICGRGPWQNLASHILRSHGVSGDEIRDCAGLVKADPLCSKSFSAALRSRIDSAAMNAVPRKTTRATPSYTNEGKKRLKEACRLRGLDRDMSQLLLHGQSISMKTCSVCGKTFWPKPNIRKRKTCSDACAKVAASMALKKDRRCSVAGCDAPHHARGFCSKHYQRARRQAVRRG